MSAGRWYEFQAVWEAPGGGASGKEKPHQESVRKGEAGSPAPL